MTSADRPPDRQQTVLDVLQILTSLPSPRGREGALASALADWLTVAWPGIGWEADVDADGSGMLIGTPAGAPARDDTLLVSHLDTSLSGDPDADVAVTGVWHAPTALDSGDEDGSLRGGGLLVAKGPAAAAIAAFAHASAEAERAGDPLRARLLLSSRGTHRAPDWSFRREFKDAEPGVQRFLRTRPHPRQAVVAKCGPAGVLWEEPGCCYFRVRLTGPWSPVLSRRTFLPDGGLVANAGPVISTVDAWGIRLTESWPVGDQAGAAFGIGAIRSGLPDKPDLLPGALELYAYLVHAGPAEVGALAADLAATIEAATVAGPLAGYRVEVTGHLVASGAATSRDAVVVRAAETAWTDVHGTTPAAIRGWTGSTDGVVLRAHKIDTVRVGPSVIGMADGVNDRLDLADLMAAQQVYERVLAILNAEYTNPPISIDKTP